VSLLGFYSNYVAIMVGMVSVLSLIFTSITSIIGHSFAKNTKDIYLKQFKLIYTINFIVGFVFFLGYYMVIDPLVIILFDNTAFLPRDLVLIITLNYFIQFMRHTTLTFKDASGLFYQDRFKPLVEGVANVILSLILVNFWGIKGVLVATIATNIFITHIVEPHVLFKYGFEKKAKNYYLINYSFIGFFALVLTIIYFIPLYTFSNNFIAILIYGSSSVLFSLILFSIAYISSKKIREQLTPLFRLRKTHTRNT
jgi:O-antigen/teichoic acid export membrane protein